MFDISTPIEREALRYINEGFSLCVDNVDVIVGHRADDSYFSYARDIISGIAGKALR